MQNTPQHWLRLLLLIGLILVMVMQAGCYRRVVSTRGIGTSAIDTQESYQEAWPIETVGRELQKNDNHRSTGQRSKQKSSTDRGGQRIFSSGN